MTKKMLHERKQPNGKKVILVAGVGVIAILVRISIIAPQFIPYLASVAVLTLIVYTSLRIIGYVKAKKCPRCGRAMVDMGYDVVFNGATNTDGGNDFSAIAIRILQCPRCEDVSYHAIDPNILQVHGDGSDLEFAYRVFDPEFMFKIYGYEMPTGSKFPGPPTMSEAEYQRLSERIQEEIHMNNAKAGF